MNALSPLLSCRFRSAFFGSASSRGHVREQPRQLVPRYHRSSRNSVDYKDTGASSGNRETFARAGCGSLFGARLRVFGFVWLRYCEVSGFFELGITLTIDVNIIIIVDINRDEYYFILN